MKNAALRAGIAAAVFAGPALGPSAGSAASPGAAGFVLKPVDRAALQRVVDATARELLVPGALVLLRTPRGSFTIAYGTTELGTAVPPASDTYFRIASNTKTMTAAIVLQLAQEGKLRLSDPVSKYVRGVPGGDHITVAELLEMRSGLYSYTDAPVISQIMDRDQSRVWKTDELFSIAFSHPPNFAPGASYEYNNTNYALLGVIAEKVGGKPLAQAMHDRLFAPLGLTHTMLPPSTVNAMPQPFSHGYLYGSSSAALSDAAPYSDQLKAAARAGTLLPTDYTGVNHSFAAAAGGVVSTAGDLAIWIQDLVSGRVLDPAYQRRWLDSLRPEDPNRSDSQQYGYGIGELRWSSNAMYFHGGETPGYNSFMGYDPVNHVTLVVWTNLTLSPDGVPTANAIMLKVLDRVYAVSPIPAPG